MSFVIVYLNVKGDAQYVKGPKGSKPSCEMGSIMVRDGVECRAACQQLNVPFNKFMNTGRPSYITKYGDCRQREEPKDISSDLSQLICRKSGI